MKKTVLIISLISLYFIFLSSVVFAETDYSYLDDMTINQLKELDAEIHKRISPSSAQAPVSGAISFSSYSDIPPQEETINAIREDEEYIKMFDNKYMTVFAKRFEDKTMIEHSKPPFFKLGFKLHLINKTNDKYLSINIASISFGKMTLNKGFYGCGYVAPMQEMYTEIVFNRILSEDEKCAFLNSYEDMINIAGTAQIYYNTDGSRSGRGLDKANFKMY